jgi:hypothetical protein
VHELALVSQERGGVRMEFDVFFRHGVCWLMSNRAVVCAAFNARLMELNSADMSGYVPEGITSFSVRFTQTCFNSIVWLVHHQCCKEWFGIRIELNQALHQFEAM